MRKPGFAISILLILAGCGLLPGGTTYPVAARDVRATLVLTEPPLFLFGNQIDRARVSRDGDGTIRWLLVDKLGTGLMTLIATTEAVDSANTRVTVAVGPPPGGRRAEIARRLDENPAIANFYKAAMEEQIDATLERREFDMMAIQGQMVAAAISIAPQMQADMDQAAKRSRASASVSPYHASPSPAEDKDEPAYGEPMDAAAGSD